MEAPLTLRARAQGSPRRLNSPVWAAALAASALGCAQTTSHTRADVADVEVDTSASFDAAPPDAGEPDVDDAPPTPDLPREEPADVAEEPAPPDVPEPADVEATDDALDDALDVSPDADADVSHADAPDVAPPCAAGLTRCGGDCVDLMSSSAHCARCGMVCPGVCVGGRCEGLVCPPGTTRCSGVCVDPRSDADHCGACGRRCPGGCVAGACAVPAGVSVGASHACVRYTGGRVFCWGTTGLGVLTAPLASGSSAHRPRPVLAVGPTGRPVVVQQLVSSGAANCGIDSTGAVTCWGEFGAFGGRPGVVPGITNARHLALNARHHLCASQADGRVRCWTGTGEAAVVAGLTDVTRVAVGERFGCAIRADRTLWCWGENTSGQLGDGTRTARAAAAQVAGLVDVVDVTAGSLHVCARGGDGEVRCWGNNDRGQLGDGTTSSPLTPVRVAAWRGATRMAAGAFATCAVIAGEVRCAGENTFGQLGDGTTTLRASPVRAGALTDVVDVAVNDAHTCALQRDARGVHQVRCWGRDDAGQLGIGHEAQASPRSVADLTDATALTAGTTHACALRRTGRVVCWGGLHAREHGQFGDGTISSRTETEPRAALTEAAGVTTATAVTAGWRHTCALLANGTVVCWGDNASGQLGDGTRTLRATPVAVSGLAGVAEVATGVAHTCARLTSGRVRCWGESYYGQVSPGRTTVATTPVDVAGVADAAQLSLGGQHSCARLRGGRVLCWGANGSGELGGASGGFSPAEVIEAARSTPAIIAPLTEVTTLSCRLGSTCAALRASGEVVAWGVGAGPRAVSWGTVPDWRGQDFHSGATCQVLGANVHCGADNEWGLAGNGMPYVTTYAGLRPDAARVASRVVGGARYVAVERVRAANNLCALREDGRVDCWGYVSGGFLNVTGLDHVVRAPLAASVPLP